MSAPALMEREVLAARIRDAATCLLLAPDMTKGLLKAIGEVAVRLHLMALELEKGNSMEKMDVPVDNPTEGFTLNDWSGFVNSWAESKGWNDQPLHIGDTLMLIVTELAEAKEDDRRGLMETYLNENGKPCGFRSEVADFLIRTFHMAGRMGINLNHEVALKMAYNQKRPYRHGGLKS